MTGEWMTKLKRAALALGAGALLLAAGEAPDWADIWVTVRDAPPPPPLLDVPAIIEEPMEFAEPAIGPVLPEAASLPAMVREVAAMDDVEMDRELECLATAIYFESKGEPLDGQLAVAQVILNRVESGRFGGSVCAVVKAPRQFSFVRSGRMPGPVNRAQWQTARAVALIAMSDGWSDVASGATHFHAVYVNPGWKLRRVARIGNHIFYR